VPLLEFEMLTNSTSKNQYLNTKSPPGKGFVKCIEKQGICTMGCWKQLLLVLLERLMYS